MGRATDFSNCYIYYIVDKDGIVHYVGSTSNFNSRKSSHKFCCNHENDPHHNFDIYKYIRANGDWDAFEMVPIRKIENISNKTELCIAENDEMKKFTKLKNMKGSYSSHEQKLKYSRDWKQKNFAKNKETKKKYYQNNIEKIVETEYKWRQNNPEKVLEKHRRYREAHRDEINKKKREKYHAKKELNKINKYNI